MGTVEAPTLKDRQESRPASTLVMGTESDNEKAQHPADEEAPGQREPPQQRKIRGVKWFAVCSCIYATGLLYGLDSTIAADVQGAVVEQFGKIEQLAWVGVGFFLGSITAILPFGALCGSLDMKWLYVASALLFEVGSVICGAAPTMNALIVGRVIAGVGGTGLYLGSLNLVSTLTVPAERGLYLGLIGFFWGLGAVLGPVVGGLFSTSSATWRWAFYINLVIGAIAAPFMLWLIPSVKYDKDAKFTASLAKMDLLGFLLGIGVWVTFTMALTMGGGQWAWNDGRTIAMLVVLGVLVIGYALQQAFSFLTTEADRSFPVPLLKSRTQVLLVVANAANITVLFVVVYYIPIYFQFVHHDSALMAAVRLLPFVIVMVVVNVIAGYALPKVRYYVVFYLVSGVLMTLGGGLLMRYFQPSTPPSYLYGFSVLTAVGSGLSFQCHYTIAGVKAPHAISQALALQNLAQMGGATIALVVAGQIFQSYSFLNLSHVLAGMGFSDADIRNAAAGVQSEVFAQLSGEMRDEAVQAITKAMQKCFILVIVGGGTTLVAGSLMKFEHLFT